MNLTRNLRRYTQIMITIYTSPTCHKCHMIKTKLNSKGIEYNECQDIERMKALNIFSLPVLEVNGELITNITDINKYVNDL